MDEVEEPKPQNKTLTAFHSWMVLCKYGQTWANDHLRIATTCLQPPRFWGPILSCYNMKLPPNNDHLSTTATNFGTKSIVQKNSTKIDSLVDNFVESFDDFIRFGNLFLKSVFELVISRTYSMNTYYFLVYTNYWLAINI